jgi:hypothetical protein
MTVTKSTLLKLGPTENWWHTTEEHHPLFQAYNEEPIRRAPEAGNQVITASYNHHYGIRALGILALMATLTSVLWKDPVMGIVSGISCVLLLGLARKLIERSKAEAIDNLTQTIRREIDARESAVRGTGRLLEQEAQQVRPATPQPNITINNNLFSPAQNNQSPLNSSPPANYQATQAHVPSAAEEHSQEGEPSPQVGYGYQTSPI